MYNEFEAITLRTANGATAGVYPYGAQVVSWRTVDGAERLFTSATTYLRSGAAIRGGVPIVFPQFAELGPLPKHGLVRTLAWQPIQVTDDNILLQLTDNDATRQHWPHHFTAQYQVTLSDQALRMRLSITNTDSQPFSFTAALHTYLRVQDIEQVSIDGLQQLRYSDKTAGGAQAVQATGSLRIAGEVDRIYFSALQPITVHEPRQRSLQCSASGFDDAVIWNPGADKAAALADLEADGYRRMLCVEAAAIGAPVSLAAGAAWSGTQVLHAV